MNNLHLLRFLVGILSKYVIHGIYRDRYLELYDRYVTVINRLRNSRGNLEMFRMVKAIRTHILAILAGQPI